MTPEQTVLIMTRGTIASLPADMQKDVARMAQQIRDWLKTGGNHDARQIAFALVGAELAAEEAGKDLS